MKKFKFIAFIMLFVLCANTISCSEKKADDEVSNFTNAVSDEAVQKQGDEVIDIENADYSLAVESGNHYMVFDDVNKYELLQNNSNLFMVHNGYVEFDSMEEFKDAVTKGTLTDSQKQTVSTFRKNDKGEIYTCDFDNLYAPTFPDNGKLESLYWYGENYGLETSFDIAELCSLQYLTIDSYDNLYILYEGFFDQDHITVVKTENIDGKTVTYYTTRVGSLKSVRYTLTDGTKTFYVEKTFNLNINNDVISSSSTIPLRIEMYCTDGDLRYRVGIHSLTEDPDDSWLLSFGLTPYVNNNNIIK